MSIEDRAVTMVIDWTNSDSNESLATRVAAFARQEAERMQGRCALLAYKRNSVSISVAIRALPIDVED